MWGLLCKGGRREGRKDRLSLAHIGLDLLPSPLILILSLTPNTVDPYLPTLGDILPKTKKQQHENLAHIFIPSEILESSYMPKVLS